MHRRHVIAGFLGVILVAVTAEAASEPPAPPGSEAAEVQRPSFSTDQIDQMVAPVALYPDPLLMQVLIASTYPLEIVEADRWVRQNASLKGDALDKAIEQKDWDPSVKGLAQFPDVLKRMSDNLDWTKDLGDAFLGQKDDVFNAVQRMRGKAQEAGTLKTTKEQTVTKEVVNNKETVVIQPADPQTVYVPQYSPATAYGPSYAPPAPYYPAMYTPGQMATASLLSFGVGVGVGYLISDGCDWGHHDVYVNNNYYGGGGGGGKGNTNVNVNKNVERNKTVNRGDRQTWQHNPEHRRNVGYRDQRTQQKFEGQRTAARDRQELNQARGYDRGGAEGGRGGRGGEGAGGGATARPGGGGGGRQMDRGGGGGGRAETRPASPGGGRGSAFGGYGNGGAARDESRRGASSRGGQSYAGAGGGQRGGGGGGGGGGRGGGGGGGRGGGGGGGGRGGGGRGGRR